MLRVFVSTRGFPSTDLHALVLLAGFLRSCVCVHAHNLILENRHLELGPKCVVAADVN